MKTHEINIRDPFVLPENGKYYLYGTRGPTCWGLADGFDVYIGSDLENWMGPIEIFKNSGDFWADRNYWAPEVFKYQGTYYLFASFKSPSKCRGTQILKSGSPLGPFSPHSDGPVTPADWECLDGTFYLDKEGKPYIVFSHEWVQAKDGEICARELSEDLRCAVSASTLLFRASSAPWVRPLREAGNYVTDGPFMYRFRSGDLGMIWSSMGARGYALGFARSDNGEIDGRWFQDEQPLFANDGGHGMIFKNFNGDRMLALHSPNSSLAERPIFIEIQEQVNNLVI